MEQNPATFYCDISSRGRLQLMGEDRVRFLNGQVTNNITTLPNLMGCYAALTNAKGKMRSDVVTLNLEDRLLLDFEPGQDAKIATELDRFIIADDVSVENVSNIWKTFTLVGDQASKILTQTQICPQPPEKLFQIQFLDPAQFGKSFLFRSRRSQSTSFDLWVETAFTEAFLKKLKTSSISEADVSALETARVEAGIPRFGAEMDENTIPSEAGIESIAISYNKGCYLGQEVIARIKSVGHVNRELVRLKLPDSAKPGEPLRFNDRDMGILGSHVSSPRFGSIGLAIVRREAAKKDTRLILPQGEAIVVESF